jgi:hypothetical protein
MGTLTVSRGVVWGSAALNFVPSAKLILLAVLATNEPSDVQGGVGTKNNSIGI